MTYHEKLMYLRGLSAAYFTVEDLAVLLMPFGSLPAFEQHFQFEEYVLKIEKIFDKGVKCTDSPLKESIEKFSGKMQEAK